MRAESATFSAAAESFAELKGAQKQLADFHAGQWGAVLSERLAVALVVRNPFLKPADLSTALDAQREGSIGAEAFGAWAAPLLVDVPAQEWARLYEELQGTSETNPLRVKELVRLLMEKVRDRERTARRAWRGGTAAPRLSPRRDGRLASACRVVACE